MGKHSHIKGLLKGDKFSGKHSTVITDAEAMVLAAKACQYVTKIALGVITPVRPSKPHLKFTQTSGCLKMQVRGIHAVQVFWLYTTEPEKTIAEIETKWATR